MHFLTFNFVQAIGLLKIGGTLVYSTCTYSPEENECQVKWILDEFKNMSLECQVVNSGVVKATV